MSRKTSNDLLTGVLVFVIGMNGLGLGMISIGADRADNPTWSLFYSFFAVEGCIVGILLLALLMAGIAAFCASDEESKHPRRIEADAKTHSVGMLYSREADVRARASMHMEEPMRASPSEKSVRSVEAQFQIQEPAEPPKPEPTAEELQESAIKQIIGGW